MANNSQFTGLQPIRPPMGGPLGPPPQNGHTLPSIPMQFRPAVPAPQAQPFIPVPSQQFQPVGPPNIGVPSHTQHFQFSQPMQQLPSRPGQVGYVLPPPPPPQPPPAIPVSDILPNRLVASVSPQPQHNSQVPNHHMPGAGGPRLSFSSSYALSEPSSGQLQTNSEAGTQYQTIPHSNVLNFPAGGQVWLPSGSQNIKPLSPRQQTGEPILVSVSTMPAPTDPPNPIEKGPSHWIEHATKQGKKYYYNRKTGKSSWDKPVELMTAIEKADASTNWREYTSPGGKKYYYNRVTKQSKWILPDELKLAREQMATEHNRGTQTEKDVNLHAPAVNSLPSVKVDSPVADNLSSIANGLASSPISVAPVVAIVNPSPVGISRLSALSEEAANRPENTIEMHASLEIVTPMSAVSETSGSSVTLANTVTTPMSISDNISIQDVEPVVNGVTSEEIEEAKKIMDIDKKVDSTVVEEKIVVQEPVLYENKQEAKHAFKALLETANVGSDWTWDQAMRVIINDRRYGALRTLSERKQTFTEFLGQKKKQEAEERRARQKKAREDFKKMLEEARELTPSTRWSKAISIFEDDERFKAIERAKDREDLYEDYMVELEKKERVKTLEEHKRNRMEYIEFLKSCDFIKASSQWRKIQDRLEADGRCSRLEKIDRLEIFQEYIRDLEKEEEELRKLQLEELRKTERKNRDEFRKLMEEHVTAGTLSAKTHWRDYCLKVKDLPAYQAVSSNTSGSTAKDLFEDVLEEVEKQYVEDKGRVKDVMTLGMMTLSSTWTFEDFKTAYSEHNNSRLVSETNLKLAFDELLERVREKEEKEAKKRKRFADDFHKLLSNSKEITASSKWQDCITLFEDRQERWFVEEQSFLQEVFEKYIMELKEREKVELKRREDKVRKDKEGKDRERKSSKERREKERALESKKEKDRHKKDGNDCENAGRAESYSLEESKRFGGDKDKKHRKRHSSSVNDINLNEIDKDRSKYSSSRATFDCKKSKQTEQHACNVEADRGSRYRRHKREHRDGSHRNEYYDEHKNRESSEDGEVW